MHTSGESFVKARRDSGSTNADARLVDGFGHGQARAPSSAAHDSATRMTMNVNWGESIRFQGTDRRCQLVPDVWSIRRRKPVVGRTSGGGSCECDGVDGGGEARGIRGTCSDGYAGGFR